MHQKHGLGSPIYCRVLGLIPRGMELGRCSTTPLVLSRPDERPVSVKQGSCLCRRGMGKIKDPKSKKVLKNQINTTCIIHISWYGLPGGPPQAQIPDPVSSRLLSLVG